MTNNNNRSSDDVIVYGKLRSEIHYKNYGIATGWEGEVGERITKPLNLSELAEGLNRKQHGEFCKCSKISDPDDFYCDCGMVDYNCALDEFLSKIREAMR